MPVDANPQVGNCGDGDGHLALWALAGWLAIPWLRVLAQVNGCGPGEASTVRTGEGRPEARDDTRLVANGLLVGCSSYFAERPSAAAAVGRQIVGKLDAGMRRWDNHQDAHSQCTEVAFQRVTSGVHH